MTVNPSSSNSTSNTGSTVTWIKKKWNDGVEVATNYVKEKFTQAAVSTAFNRPAWNDQARQIIALLKNTLHPHFKVKHKFSGKPKHIEKSLKEIERVIKLQYREVVDVSTYLEKHAIISRHVKEDFGKFLTQDQQKDLTDLLTDLYQLSTQENLTNLRGEVAIGDMSVVIGTHENNVEISLVESYRKYTDLVEIFRQYQYKYGGVLSTLAYELGVDDETLDNIFASSNDIPAIFQKLKIWLEKVKPGMLDAGKDYLIKQAARGACNLLKKLSPNDEARRFLEEMIAKLSEIDDADDKDKRQEALYACISKFLDFCSQNPVYVNNFKIPGTGFENDLSRRKGAQRNDPHRPFYRNLIEARRIAQAHKKAPKNAPKTQKEIFEENKALFIHNNRHFLVMKFIFETFCNLQAPEPTFYCELIDKATSMKAKKAFFEALDQSSKLGPVRRFFAKTLYYILMPISTFMVQLGTDVLTEEVRHYIKQQKKRNFEDAENTFINFSEKLLGDISGSYTDIVNHQLNKGSLDDALGIELSKPTLFDNKTPEEVQLKIAMAAWKKLLFKIDLATLTYNYFNSWHIQAKSTWAKILALPLQAIVFSIKYLTYTVLYLPSLVIRSVVEWVGNYFIKKNNPVGIIVEATTSKLKEPSSLTFAMNQILYNMLEDFIEQLTHPNRNQTQKIPPLDKAKKQKLMNIMLLFMQTVEKSRAHNYDALKKHIENTSAVKDFMDSVKEMGIESSQDVLAHVLLVGFRTFLNEEQFENQLSNFMGAVNRSYEVGNPIDKKEFVELESAIGEQLRYMRHLIITDVVEENFGQSGDTLSKNTKIAVDKLKKSTANFTSEMKAHFDLMKKNVNQAAFHFHDNITGSSKGFKKQAQQICRELEKVNDRIQDALEESIDYQDRQNSKNLGNVADIIAQIRNTLRDYCSELNKLINSLSESSIALNQLQKSIIPSFQKKIVAPFKAIYTEFKKDRRPSLEKLMNLQNQLYKDGSAFSFLEEGYSDVAREYQELMIEYHDKLSEEITILHAKALKDKLEKLCQIKEGDDFHRQVKEAKRYYEHHLKGQKYFDEKILLDQTFENLTIQKTRSILDTAISELRRFGKKKEDIKFSSEEAYHRAKAQDLAFIERSKVLLEQLKTSTILVEAKVDEVSNWAKDIQPPPVHAFDILNTPLKAGITNAISSMLKGPAEQATRLISKKPVGQYAFNSALHFMLRGDFTTV